MTFHTFFPAFQSLQNRSVDLRIQGFKSDVFLAQEQANNWLENQLLGPWHCLAQSPVPIPEVPLGWFQTSF
jgi:hypothetical protein